MSNALPLAWRLRAVAAALVLPPALRLVSLARLMSLVALQPAAALPAAAPLDDAALARWVNGLLRRLPGPWHLTCLSRSVVLYHLLRRAGRPVELCIGVFRPAGGSVGAHAWLVLHDVPYLEHEPARATALPVIARFPEPGPVPA